jgi:hypothetical protein
MHQCQAINPIYFNYFSSGIFFYIQNLILRFDSGAYQFLLKKENPRKESRRSYIFITRDLRLAGEGERSRTQPHRGRKVKDADQGPGCRWGN